MKDGRNESILTLEEAIDQLLDNTRQSRKSWATSLEKSLAFRAAEFLRFAEKDLEAFDSQNDERHLDNALSNAKRALHCQIDSILGALGLSTLAEKQNWNFPKKIEMLNSVGILAPRILTKINRARNLLEHAYRHPDHKDVLDFVDIVALFMGSTQTYVYLPQKSSHISFLGDLDSEAIAMKVEFRPGEEAIEILICGKPSETGERTMESIFKFSPNDENYLKCLQAYLTTTNPHPLRA